MGRPDFEDSVIGDNSEADRDAGIVGYVQESADGTGYLMASGAPVESGD